MTPCLCKPPETIFFTRNAVCNWQELEEQLTWFLADIELSKKSNSVKIRIMLTHSGKETCKIYKIRILPWTEPDDKMKFNKVVKAFKEFCQPCTNIL